MTWSFVAVVMIAVVTPGADTAAVLRTATKSRAHGIAAVAGIVTGQIIHTGAAITGLAFVLQASATGYEFVRWLGAAYLLALGLSSIRSALRASPGPTQPAGDRRADPIAGYRTGLIANLANPKTTLFFASLLPQFVPDGAATPHLILAAGIVIAASAAWYLALALLAARARTWLDQPTVQRSLDTALGIAFVGLSARLAITQRS